MMIPCMVQSESGRCPWTGLFIYALNWLAHLDDHEVMFGLGGLLSIFSCFSAASSLEPSDEEDIERVQIEERKDPNWPPKKRITPKIKEMADFWDVKIGELLEKRRISSMSTSKQPKQIHFKGTIEV